MAISNQRVKILMRKLTEKFRKKRKSSDNTEYVYLLPNRINIIYCATIYFRENILRKRKEGKKEVLHKKCRYPYLIEPLYFLLWLRNFISFSFTLVPVICK